MDLPPFPAVAALFPCTISQAFLPLQSPIATCLSPDGGGGEGGGKGDLSAVAVARAVEFVRGLAKMFWPNTSGYIVGTYIISD